MATQSEILTAMGIDAWVLRPEPGLIETENLPAIKECQACSLSRPEITPLAGVGATQASLLVIAEYAVSESNVFSPKAGALFSAMMRGIRCKSKDIFITNTLKCATTEKPSGNEASICGGHLRQQIETLQPKAILCLGALAAQTLLKTDTPIGKLRQSTHETQTTPVVVSYHPEYLLRQPSQKSAAWQDLLLLAPFL